MRGRNRLLSEPSPDAAWLDAIETEMAELGVAIAAARREWAALAVAMIDVAGRRSAFPTAELALSGSLEGDLDGFAAREVEERYRKLLRDERGADAAAGRTLVGPHRSDLLVRHAPKDMPAEILLDRRAEGAARRPRPRPGPARRQPHRRDAGDPPRRDRRPSRRDPARGPVRGARRPRRAGLHDRHRRGVFAPLGDGAQRGRAADGRIEMEPA